MARTLSSHENYLSAIRDFVHQTIVDPSFFQKEPEEQKEMAMDAIREHQKNQHYAKKK